MNNQVNLTDDELSYIMTGLTMTLMSLERYKEQGNVLDVEQIIIQKGMQLLQDRLNDEYY